MSKNEGMVLVSLGSAVVNGGSGRSTLPDMSRACAPAGDGGSTGLCPPAGDGGTVGLGPLCPRGSLCWRDDEIWSFSDGECGNSGLSSEIGMLTRPGPPAGGGGTPKILNQYFIYRYANDWCFDLNHSLNMQTRNLYLSEIIGYFLII